MQPIVASTSAAVCLSLSLCAAAAAQTVYRCGPAGNQYSQQPCADGKTVDVSDRRSAEQLAEARKAVAEQRRRAVLMARERVAAERASPPAAAGSIGPKPAADKPADGARQPTPAKRKTPKKLASAVENDKTFVAVVPGSGRHGRKKQPQAQP